MGEATLSHILAFEKKLAGEKNSGDFLANLNRVWPLLRLFGRSEVSPTEIKGLLEEIRARVARFQPGVLDSVKAVGSQFAKAALTVVPGGETLEAQWDTDVIGFWTAWDFNLDEGEELTVEPSIASEVIYLPGVIEGSLCCTYDRMGDYPCVEGILNLLPRVEGLRWIIGNTVTVNRVLINHLKETSGQDCLLRSGFTWTTDSFKSSYYDYGLERLIVGDFSGDTVYVNYLKPSECIARSGVFALGVPA